MATRSREVEARSEAYKQQCQPKAVQDKQESRFKRNLLGAFAFREVKAARWHLAGWSGTQSTVSRGHRCHGFAVRTDLGQQLRLGDLLVDLLGEILVGFVRCFGHLGRLVANFAANVARRRERGCSACLVTTTRKKKVAGVESASISCGVVWCGVSQDRSSLAVSPIARRSRRSELTWAAPACSCDGRHAGNVLY